MEEASEGSLLGDLKRMLQDESFTDMVFLCGDLAEKVPASRMLVAARSPVLEAMLLKAGMRESTQTRIALPEIDAETMRICLEFVHTDTIKQSSSSPQHEAFVKVIAAAKFLLIPKLEQVALSCLRVHTKSSDIFWATPHLLLDTVKAYTRGVDILHAHNADDIHLQKVLCDMASAVEMFEGAWPWPYLKYLSRRALAHLVQNVAMPTMEQNTLWEYFLFVKVVSWCAYQLVLHADDPITEEKQFRKVIEEFLPGWWKTSRTELYVTALKDLDEKSLRVFSLLKEPLTECLEHVPIKLYKIPPLILSMNIEPLGILSSSALLSAYRVQALSGAPMRWDHLGHHECYHVLSGGNETYCTSKKLAGFVRGSTCIERSTIVHFEWEIVILQACEHLRVGFCFGDYFSGLACEQNTDTVLGDKYLCWALSTDGRVYHDGKAEKDAYCDAFAVTVGLRIGVHLTRRTVAFSVNGSKGVNLSVPYYCVPDEDEYAVMYPAISMVSPGRARIEMVVQDWMERTPHMTLLHADGHEAHRQHVKSFESLSNAKRW